MYTLTFFLLHFIWVQHHCSSLFIFLTAFLERSSFIAMTGPAAMGWQIPEGPRSPVPPTPQCGQELFWLVNQAIHVIVACPVLLMHNWVWSEAPQWLSLVYRQQERWLIWQSAEEGALSNSVGEWKSSPVWATIRDPSKYCWLSILLTLPMHTTECTLPGTTHAILLRHTNTYSPHPSCLK